MPTKTAKLFNNGGSQAVRLPAEFKFDGDEVYVHKDERTGDLILSPKQKSWTTWAEYLDLLRQDKDPIPDEFMADRPLNAPFPDRHLFEDED